MAADAVDVVGGNAVHDNQRVAVADGGDASDLDVGSGTRIASRTCHRHAGDGSLQRAGQHRHLPVGHRVAVYRTYGTRQVLLLHRAVTDHNHLVQKRFRFVKHYIHLVAGSYLHLLGAESYIGKGKHVAFRRLDAVVAVHADHGTCFLTLHRHGGSDQRLSAAVPHESGDFLNHRLVGLARRGLGA